MTREAVLLVHGHGAHPVLLGPLRRALERREFRAVNWSYRSLRGSFEAHAARPALTGKESRSYRGLRSTSGKPGMRGGWRRRGR